jgi:hypothetical protein
MKCAEILCSFIVWVGVIFVVRRFCVSMLARLIAAIYIACFYPCSRSCFCLFFVKLLNSASLVLFHILAFVVSFGSVQERAELLDLLARLLVLRLVCSECGGVVHLGEC